MHIMKRRILYSLLITATLGLSSCESFLSENPKDQITEEQAYQNSTLLYLNTVASFIRKLVLMVAGQDCRVLTVDFMT